MKNSGFKKYLQNIILLILFQSSFVFSQNHLVGNSYTALIGTSCKELMNGGCTIKNFCTLKFEKTTVGISYFAEAYCSPKDSEKFYEENARRDKITLIWSEEDSIITIKDFDDFGNLSFSKNILFGTKEVDGKLEELKFIHLER